MHLCNANISILYIINMSFIFIKCYNFPFIHVVFLYAMAELFTDT